MNKVTVTPKTRGLIEARDMTVGDIAVAGNNDVAKAGDVILCCLNLASAKGTKLVLLNDPAVVWSGRPKFLVRVLQPGEVVTIEIGGGS